MIDEGANATPENDVAVHRASCPRDGLEDAVGHACLLAGDFQVFVGFSDGDVGRGLAVPIAFVITEMAFRHRWFVLITRGQRQRLGVVLGDGGTACTGNNADEDRNGHSLHWMKPLLCEIQFDRKKKRYFSLLLCLVCCTAGAEDSAADGGDMVDDKNQVENDYFCVLRRPLKTSVRSA